MTLLGKSMHTAAWTVGQQVKLTLLIAGLFLPMLFPASHDDQQENRHTSNNVNSINQQDNDVPHE